MENELLKIFDKTRNQIGVATREEVHGFGYWHDAFHCWFIGNENDTTYIYLQLRSDMKKDYPSLFDITAAGHVLAHETVQDGVREIKEELGIDVSLGELVPLGVINYWEVKGNFIDKEFAHTFFYKTSQTFDDFTLQKEEVSGIVKVVFNDFSDLWCGKKETVTIQGFKYTETGDKILINENIGREKFVPHHISFYQTVIKRIKENI